MHFYDIVPHFDHDDIVATELRQVHFNETRSGILQANDNMAFCFKLLGLEGLFRKDQEPSKQYGRYVCDLVKDTFDCGGFFTSDELPRYGITRREKRYLFTEMDKTPSDGDLVVICVYDADLSTRIRDYLIDYLRQELANRYPLLRQAM